MKKILATYLLGCSLGLGAWAMEEKEEQKCQDTSSQHSSFTQNTQEGQQSSKDCTVFGQTSIWGFTAQELKEIPLVKSLEEGNLDFSKIQKTPVAEGTNLGVVSQVNSASRNTMFKEVLLVAEKGGDTQKITLGDTVLCYIWNQGRNENVGFPKDIIDFVNKKNKNDEMDLCFMLYNIADVIENNNHRSGFMPQVLEIERMCSIFTMMMIQHMYDDYTVMLDQYFRQKGDRIINHYRTKTVNQPTFRELWRTCQSQQEYIAYCQNTWNMQNDAILPYPVSPMASKPILNNFPVELDTNSDILPQTYFQTGQLNVETPLPPEGEMFMDQLVYAKQAGLVSNIKICFLFGNNKNIDPRTLVQGVVKMLKMGLSLDETPSNIRSLTFFESKWTLNQIQDVQSMQGILKGSVGKKQWKNDFTLTMEQLQGEGDIVPFDHCNSSLFCWKKTKGHYGNFVINSERNTLFFDTLRVAQKNYSLIFRKEIIWDLFGDCFMPRPKDTNK